MIVVAIKFPGGIASAGPALRRQWERVRSPEARQRSTPSLELDVAELRIDDSDLGLEFEMIDLDGPAASGRRSRRRAP